MTGKKARLLAVFLFAVMQLTVAQDKKNVAESNYINIRINPLSVAEFDMNVMAGVEWKFSERFSIGGDLAYIFWHYGSGTGTGNPTSGYKIRPELRYYFKQTPKINWFAAAEASYKRTSTDKDEEVCMMQGQAPGCAYFQRIDYREVKSAPGGSVKVGLQQYFGRNRKLFYELFLGIGFKVISKSKKNYVLPPGANPDVFVEKDYIFFEEGFSPHLPAGIKLGIRL